jgi:lysophospholipase L1-like esterase
MIVSRRRRDVVSVAVAILAGLCVQAGAAPKAATSRGAPAGLSRKADPLDARGLDRFFQDLHRLQTGQLQRLHILQIGDSHTAGDFFTGYLRQALQARFGDAGRGAMPPGLAYPGIRQVEVTVDQAGRWDIHNSRTATDSLPYGLSGFILTSGAAGAAMSVSPNDGSAIETAGVDFVQHPGGGAIAVRFDGQWTENISTSGPDGVVKAVSVTPPPGAHSFELQAEAPGIDIADWSIGKLHPGIVLDSFGVVGATVNIVQRWDPDAVRQELARLAPSLIILSYGTNEGFGGALDLAGYEVVFAEVLNELTADAPQASILVIGPPDAKRSDGRCAHGRTRKRPCGWTTPPDLALVRDAQRRIAARSGNAFWDWSSVMEHGIEPWVRAVPPLARPDHVHFTIPGYERAAEALDAQLMARFASFERDHGAHAPGR